MDFLFKLQRFAEGDTPSGDATPGAGAPDTTNTSDTTPVSQEPSGDNGYRALVTDPQTGRQRIVTTPPEGKEEDTGEGGNTPAPSEPAEEPAKQEEPASAPKEEPPASDVLIHTEPYTLDQLNAAIQTNTVDESRIPHEYAIQYMQYRQEQARRQNEMKAQQQQMQAQRQKEAEAQQRQLLSQIDELAKKQALQALGMKEEDLSLSEYSDDAEQKAKIDQYRTAVMMNKQQIIFNLQAQRQQAQAAQQQQAAIYQSIQEYVADKQKTEPHFAEINQMMNTYYKQLPYEKAYIIADAINAMNSGTINEQQCKVLEAYYNDTRTQFYAKQNDLSKTPKKVAVPKVEQPGTGAQEPKRPVDFTKLRTMTDRERRAFLANFWHGQNQ